MSKKTLSIQVNDKDYDYFQQLRKKDKSEGKAANLTFKEFVDAHKEKHEGELK